MTHTTQEIKLNKILNELLVPTLNLTTDKFSVYDAYTTTSILEYKIRNTQYKDSVLETSKRESVLALSKHFNKVAYFVNMNPKYIKIFDLNITPNTIHKFAPTTTSFKNKEKIDKTFCSYKDKDALMIFKLRGKKWIDITQHN